MIRSDAGPKASREALVNLEEALLDLTRNRARYHPATFALLTAAIADEIRARRTEIDEYIGVGPTPSDQTAGGLAPDRAPPGIPMPAAEPSPAAK
jgi:hypothetical protein